MKESVIAMNLKKAFQYQKALKELANALAYECTKSKYYVKITEEHHKDEINKMNPNYSYEKEIKDLSDLELGKYDLGRVIEIYNAIVKWRTALALGIAKAKAKIKIGPDELDYDAAIIYANDKRYVLGYYGNVAELKKQEEESLADISLVTDMATADVKYTVKKVVEPIAGAVEAVVEERRLLKAELEKISDEIEEATLTTKIDEKYIPPIPLNIEIEEIYENFEDYK